MTLSGFIGTLTGLATCGLMIYKKPNMGDAMTWLTVLTSFTTGVVTYYSVHELIVRYPPRNIVEFLDGDIDQIYRKYPEYILNNDFRQTSKQPLHFPHGVCSSTDTLDFIPGYGYVIKQKKLI